MIWRWCPHLNVTSLAVVGDWSFFEDGIKIEIENCSSHLIMGLKCMNNFIVQFFGQHIKFPTFKLSIFDFFK